MKGLLYKDMRIVTLQYGWILLFSFLCLFAGIFMQNFFLIVYPMLLINMSLPLSLFSLDATDGWEAYCCSLPCSRATIITEKYLLTLPPSLVCLAVNLLLLAFRRSLTPLDFICIVVLVFIGPSLMFPLIAKLGVNRGRIFHIIIFAAVAGLSSIFSIEALPDLSGYVSWPVAIIAVICLALLYLLSWRLSIHFYEKRDL